MTGARMSARTDELREALRASRTALAVTAGGFINLLMLTGPLFMLQVYDRVLPSRSIPTLVGLMLFALVLYAFQGMLETLRARLLLRIGLDLDARLSPRVFDLIIRNAQAGPTADGLQVLRNLDTVRSFFSGSALSALFDLPWMPLYVAICFALHPLLGGAVLGGAGGARRHHVRDRERHARADAAPRGTSRRRGFQLAEQARRNTGLLHALGMRTRMRAALGATQSAVYLA